MSNQDTNTARRGQQHRRRRNNRNNRSNNRNRSNRNNSNTNRTGNRSTGTRGQGRRSHQRPEPLTWWQKLLKKIGLYKVPKSGAKASGRVKSHNKNTSKEKPHVRDTKQIAAEARKVDSRRLYIGNLSYDATEQDLKELFKGVGDVRHVEIIYNRHTQRSKGYGFIEMLTVDEAKRAVEVLHDQFYMGRKMRINVAKSERSTRKTERSNPRRAEKGSSDQDKKTLEDGANIQTIIEDSSENLEKPSNEEEVKTS